jgi:uncharacterized protein
VAVRGEAVAEVLPDAADLVVTIEVRDAGTGSGAGRVARASLAAAAPALELQPGPHEVHGCVEMTFTMSPPEQEVYAR